jgi:hypothetical protein
VLQESRPRKCALALQRACFSKLPVLTAMQVRDTALALEECCASRNKIPHSVTKS